MPDAAPIPADALSASAALCCRHRRSGPFRRRSVVTIRQRSVGDVLTPA